jgi:hypothetical protein
MAVGLGLGDRGRRNHVGAAGAVLDNEGLFEPLLELCPSRRESQSVEPPAGNGTTRVTVLLDG